MSKFYIPTQGSGDWKAFLAKPDLHWKKGYSARILASSWEEAGGFPQEVSRVFDESGMSMFRNLEMLLAFPEYKVPLPGGKTSSQNDLFVLARASDSLVTITVEGKVDEPFAQTLGEWLKNGSKGKNERLQFLSETLKIDLSKHLNIRYQLVHRTASALILARSFHAKKALMLVHSFSQKDMWFEDFRELVKLFNSRDEPKLNGIVNAYTSIRGIYLYFGWVKGDPRYLEM